MLNLSELQTHWVTNYVCSHRGAPRREQGMGGSGQQTTANTRWLRGPRDPTSLGPTNENK